MLWRIFQVKNMPDTLHERLRRHARERGCTMSAAALRAIEREIDLWEWSDRLAQRPKTELGIDAAALVAGERTQRGSGLG